MKKNYLILFLVLVCSATYSQEWTEKLVQKLEQKDELTFFDYQDAFYTWCEENDANDGYIEKDGVKEKVPGWKQFKRWEWYWETRIDGKTGKFPKTSALEQLNKIQKKFPNQKSNNGNWAALGPFNPVDDYPGEGIGRINCVEFHTDPNIIYVGSPSGGLWKTADGGNTWTVLTDENDVLGVSAIIVIPGNPYDIIYIGTGDRDGGSISSLGGGQGNDNNGVGVLKSLDGGITWQSMGLSYFPSDKITINSLKLDPTDVNTIYAGTTEGIYKTTNAGQTWELILASPVMDNNGFIDIEMHPTNQDILYASTDEYTTWFHSYIYKTIDGGQTWSVVNAIGAGWRTEIAVSIAQPDWVYAVVASSNGGLLSIHRSTDSGETFSEVFNGSELNLLGYNSYGTSNGGQGTYDLTLTVDPNNANLVYVGGINAWKSADGGSTWSILNSHNTVAGEPHVHADKHFMGFQNNTSVMFEGNDGGLDKTTDGGINYESLSDGLVISQMYRLGVSQTEPEATICGFQDNGTKLRQPDNTWRNVYGGDGMECIIDYSDYNIKYFSMQNGYLHRKVGLYGNTQIYANGLPVPGPWVTSFVIDPNDNQVLYAGYNDIWKTTDQGDSWSSISNFGSGNINALAVAPSNSNFIYTSKKYTDGFYKTSNGGSNWQNIISNLQLDMWSTITYISVKDDDPNTLWVSVGSYNEDGVFQSTDAGETWTNISSGLPEIPIMCVIQNKQNTNAVELYAATDIGVYVKYGDNDWFPFYDGMPNVVVTELEIYYDSEPANSKIRASTYGRGLWESDLIDSSPPIIVQQPGSIQGCESDSLSLMVSASNALFYQWYFDGNAISGANDSIIYFNPANSSSTGSYYCEVSNIPGSVNSDAVSVVIGENPAPEISGDLSICDGEISILDAGSGYSLYLWSTGENTQMINVSEEGNYSVSVATVYGCEGNDEVFVSLTYIPDMPVISADGPVVFCDTETVTITVDSPQTGVVYHWSNGQTGNTIVVNETGEYSCYGQEGECEGENSNVISVTVNPTPDNPIISGDDPDLCEGETCTITVDDSQTGVVYYWSNGETGNSIMVTEAGSYYCYGDTGNCQSENSDIVDVTVTSIPETPAITADGPTTFCDIESVTLSVDSPQTGITYHWTNGEIGNSITVNESSDYSCYGSNDECESESSNVILVTAYMTPVIPDVSANDPTLCEGETCIITISNVQTGVTYYWSNGETGTSIMVNEAGTFYCYGDGGECQSENSVSIDVTVDEMPDTPIIIANGPTDLCEDESVELSVDSPQAGVVYYWSTGQPGISITVTSAGDYSCYGQNGECVSNDSNEISVSVNPIPETPMILANNTALCEGEVCTLTVNNPEAGVTYEWSNGETGNSIEVSEANTYFCYGDNGDCQGENSNTQTVQMQAIPVPDFSSDGQGGSAPLTVQFEDVSTGSPVLWFWNFGDGSVSTAQNPSHTYENTGVYSVSLEVTTSFGCNDEIVKEDYIDVITGISNQNFDPNVRLYPNPSKGEIYLEISAYTGTIKASVFNLFGVEVISETWEESSEGDIQKFDLSDQKPGTYYLVLQINGEKVVKRFVVL